MESADGYLGVFTADGQARDAMHLCLMTRHLFIGDDDSGNGAASAAVSPVILGVGVPVTWTMLTQKDRWRGDKTVQK